MAALCLLNEVQIPQHDMQALYGFKVPLQGLYLSIKPILNSVESDSHCSSGMGLLLHPLSLIFSPNILS